MIRIIFWAALIYLAFWAWRRFKSPARSSAKPQANSHEQAPHMVRCANCGLHLPESRAVRDQDEWYCGQRHLEEGPRPRAR